MLDSDLPADSLWWGLEKSFPSAGVSSGGGQAPALLLCPVRDRAGSARPLDSILVVLIIHCGNMSHGHQPRPWLLLGHGPRQGHNSSLALVPCGYTGHLNCYGFHSSKTLGHKHSHRTQPRPWASAWPLLASWATDITSPNCDRTWTQTWCQVADGT